MVNIYFWQNIKADATSKHKNARWPPPTLRLKKKRTCEYTSKRMKHIHDNIAIKSLIFSRIITAHEPFNSYNCTALQQIDLFIHAGFEIKKGASKLFNIGCIQFTSLGYCPLQTIYFVPKFQLRIIGNTTKCIYFIQYNVSSNKLLSEAVPGTSIVPFRSSDITSARVSKRLR